VLEAARDSIRFFLRRHLRISGGIGHNEQFPTSGRVIGWAGCGRSQRGGSAVRNESKTPRFERGMKFLARRNSLSRIRWRRSTAAAIRPYFESLDGGRLREIMRRSTTNSRLYPIGCAATRFVERQSCVSSRNELKVKDHSRWRLCGTASDRSHQRNLT